MSKPSFQTAKSDQEFVALGAGVLKSKIQSAIASRGKAVVGLSGGETPGPIYDKFISDKEIDWSKVNIIKYIEATHKDSNTRLVKSLIDKNSDVKYNFLHPDSSLPLQQAIEKYEADLKKLLSDGPADVLTLGLGPDGHIASLFPPVSEALQNETKLVIHTTTTQFAVFDRITVSFPILLQAKSRVFFMKSNKKPVWDEMEASPYNPTRWPAHKVIATGETIVVLF